MTDLEHISLLYRRLLGREPDEEGLSFYLGLLKETGDMRSIIESFVSSLEYRSGPQDLSALIAATKRNNGYLARQEINMLYESYCRDDKRLEPHGFKVSSQADEDGIIEEIFKRLNIECGAFCEIGVQNGLECNSLYLVHKGWRGTWVEGDLQQRDFIEKKFSNIIDKRITVCFSFVTKENINKILDSLNPGFTFEVRLWSIC